MCVITDLVSSVSGTNLVKKAIYAMVEGDCDEVRRTQPQEGFAIDLCVPLLNTQIHPENIKV